MKKAHALALLGGPSSGKTTYLGALVDALDTSQLTHLENDGLPADARALRRLAEPLLDGQYPQRTKAERHVFEAHLRTKGNRFSPTAFVLRVADYAGEEVERLFQERTRGWSEEWQERALANGILLFLRPEAVKPLPRLEAPVPMRPLPPGAASSATSDASIPVPLLRPSAAPDEPAMAFGPGLAEEAPPPPIKAPGDPVPVPTVFELIELLQFIRHVRGLAPGERPQGEERFRIALLVTAWDSADPHWQREGPHRYLAEHAPLLEDFLWSNFSADDVFRFGLSSTGGDLRNPAYREQYLDNPHGEVFWADTRGEIVRSPDLSVPLCWALFGDQALVPSP